MALYRRQQSQRREVVRAALATPPEKCAVLCRAANPSSSFFVSFVTFCKNDCRIEVKKEQATVSGALIPEKCMAMRSDGALRL
jgi:hypothetical protein